MDVKKENGFTLIEVIISFAIITLILGVLLNINLVGFRFFDINQENIELSQALSIVTANLDKQIRSMSIDDIELSDKIQNNSSPEEYKKLTIDSVSNEYKYYLNNQSLIIETNSKLKNVAKGNVNNIKFSKSDNLVNYTIMLVNDNKEYEISNSIFPRNILIDEDDEDDEDDEGNGPPPWANNKKKK